jgi:hypothetical protein
MVRARNCNAGKTNLLINIFEEEVKNIEPTKGFNLKTIVHDKFMELRWATRDKEILVVLF